MPDFFRMRMSFERSILQNMRVRFLSFSLLFSLACSAGTNGGCADCAALPNVPYPQEASSIDEAAAARITQHSLDFFRKNLVSLLSQYLTVVKQGECLIESSAPECPFGQKATEDIAVLDINKLTVSTGVGDSSEFPLKFRDGCIEDTGEEQKTYDNCPEQKRTRISILYMPMAKLEESFELEWVSESGNSDTTNAGSGLHVTISNLEMEADLVLALESSDEIDDSDPIAALLNSLSASCWLTSPLDLPALTIPKIDFTMGFKVNAEGKLEPSISVSEVTITEDDQTNSINMQVKPCVASGVKPECQDTLCPTAVGTENICTELCEVGNLLATVLPALTSQIQPVLNQLAQGLATQLQTSLAEGFEGLKLGIETVLDPAALSPLLSDAKPLNVQFKIHNDNLRVQGEENAPGTGLHATLSAGISAQSRAACAIENPQTGAESLSSILPEFGGFLEVPSDQEGNTTFEPYHMAFTVSEAMLTQMGTALYHSGVFCVGLGSQDIHDMSGILLDLKFLTALEPGLQDIAPAGSPNENAPIHLGLFATKPPIFSLGSGKVIAPPKHCHRRGYERLSRRRCR
ncbi:MAG: hypothetical protein VYA34_14185 [Myxococcota bacterium]|nr:hypothetical protein [Myxococcota bacterium]